MRSISKFIIALSASLTVAVAVAGESPQEQRHDLMEHVGDAAKAVGQMLKGEAPFDAEIAMQSFQTWHEAAGKFGDLFPEGTETGYDTRAKAAIWTDREGFESALRAFSDAVDEAIAAAPQDLDALNVAAGP
ncbi:MAG: cytochrome c, partial [Lysobacterales bacterium]